MSNFLTPNDMVQIKNLIGHLNGVVTKDLAVEAKLYDSNGEHVGTVKHISDTTHGPYGFVMDGDSYE